MPTAHTSTRLPRITIAEAAKRTNLSPQTIRRRIATGELRAYRSGRNIRIDESDLAALFTEVNPATFAYVNGADGIA